MKLLLHICCAPCANRPVAALREEGIAVAGFWYNPNIHPFTEYRSRRETVRAYAKTENLPLFERDEYGLRPFVRAVADDIDGRCVTCYRLRLEETAAFAAQQGFDAFTSSLFISPYQNHALMRQVAAEAAARNGITFFDRDFRPLFQSGQQHAREHCFYMQKYCGCVFSEQERYQKPGKIIP